VARVRGRGLADLLAPTPPTWLDAACARWQELLVDHAYCEKKAASTALALLFAYPESGRRNLELARLAREELRHFEQVTRMMARLAVPFRRLRPGRYAGELRAALRTSEPHRQIDLLLAGALIEARSCERFALLAPRLPEPLGGFYAELGHAEARHGELYLAWAQESAEGGGGLDWCARLRELADIEARLICGEDSELRFHSGPPAPAECPPGA
jgi:tRNA 2-(methylsulfanyl)-N6-isopentenyladenosine37 hydroxylase